ncbi:hypothetical protein NM208_g17153 [Fusarium decemcellulare]|uniref:Uncharacterized protein n=1 Tax=Fusarium decemcellulare TaxID=57161 RepID=A0ACC1RAT3_9HYPO|nr:hypothetical protein NM208_g17153 [Fusarium decemcellulare]
MTTAFCGALAPVLRVISPSVTSLEHWAEILGTSPRAGWASELPAFPGIDSEKEIWPPSRMVRIKTWSNGESRAKVDVIAFKIMKCLPFLRPVLGFPDSAYEIPELGPLGSPHAASRPRKYPESL